MKRPSPVAVFLRDARVKAGYSQKQVADLLGYRSAQFVSNWERGLTTPPGRTLRRLADVYGVSAETLYEVLLEFALRRTEQRLELEYFGRRGRAKG